MLPSGSALKPRTVLTSNNYTLFQQEISAIHAPKSTYLAQMFKDATPDDYQMPRENDMVK